MGDDPHSLGVTDLPTGAPPAVEILEGDEVSARATTQEATVSHRADGVVVEAGGRTFGPYPSSQAAGRQRRRARRSPGRPTRAT